MGKVFFKDPIEYISGKIAKKFSTIYNRRVKPTTNTNRNYTSVHGERSTAASTTEIARWTRFGAISAATTARLQNATKRIQDEAAFKAQNAYSTLRQYVWHKEAATYDAED